MSKRQKTTSITGTSITLYSAPDRFVSPTVILYGVGIPQDDEGTWYPDESSKPWVIYMPQPDPLDFLRPLLNLGVDAKDACVLWAKFKDGAIAIVGLAKLCGQKPMALVNNPDVLESAFKQLKSMM